MTTETTTIGLVHTVTPRTLDADQLRTARVLARAIAALLDVTPTSLGSVAVHPDSVTLETFTLDEAGNKTGVEYFHYTAAA